MARTIWFSNWNFQFSRVNGKDPRKCQKSARLKCENLLEHIITSCFPFESRRLVNWNWRLADLVCFWDTPRTVRESWYTCTNYVHVTGFIISYQSIISIIYYTMYCKISLTKFADTVICDLYFHSKDTNPWQKYLVSLWMARTWRSTSSF